MQDASCREPLNTFFLLLTGSCFDILIFFIHLRNSARGLAHPDSYREARVCEFFDCSLFGGLAQLARACDWQSQGQGFDSPNLHSDNKTVIKI